MASLSYEITEELLDYLQLDYKLSDTAIGELSTEISQNDSEIMELKLAEINT